MCSNNELKIGSVIEERNISRYLFFVTCQVVLNGNIHSFMFHVRSQSFGSIFPLISPIIWLSAFTIYRADRSATTRCIRKKEFKNCNSWFRSRRYRMARIWSAHRLRNSRSLIRYNSWRIRVRFFSRRHSFFADMMRSCWSLSRA